MFNINRILLVLTALCQIGLGHSLTNMQSLGTGDLDPNTVSRGGGYRRVTVLRGNLTGDE